MCILALWSLCLYVITTGPDEKKLIDVPSNQRIQKDYPDTRKIQKDVPDDQKTSETEEGYEDLSGSRHSRLNTY